MYEDDIRELVGKAKECAKNAEQFLGELKSALRDLENLVGDDDCCKIATLFDD